MKNELKKMMNIENLNTSYAENDTMTLEFNLNGKMVYLKNITEFDKNDEYYWDSAENVSRAIAEAEEDEIELEDGAYAMTLTEEGSTQILAIGTEQELITYWNNSKEQLTGWMTDTAEDKANYEKAISEEIETIADLEYLFKELNYSWWTLEIA